MSATGQQLYDLYALHVASTQTFHVTPVNFALGHVALAHCPSIAGDADASCTTWLDNVLLLSARVPRSGTAMGHLLCVQAFPDFIHCCMSCACR